MALEETKAAVHIQDYILSKRQQVIADAVLELPFTISRDHESFGLPPEDPDMRKLWTRNLQQRFGRVADQISGAQSAKVDASKLLTEASVIKCMLAMATDPRIRLQQYRSHIEVLAKEQKDIHEKKKALQTKADANTQRISDLRRLITDVKMEIAAEADTDCEADSETQQEAQRIENHERALRHDLERQTLTYEQQRQEAYHMLDAIRAETASLARTAPTSEVAAREHEMSEQLHRECERLQREGQRIEQVNQMQRKNDIAEQIAEAQADLKREEIQQEHVIQQQTPIAANKLLEEHYTVQREREVVYQQAELQLEAQRHIQNKCDQLEAKEAEHQRATQQHQLFFNEAQALQQQMHHRTKYDQHQREQFLERYGRYEAEMHQQQQLANSELQAAQAQRQSQEEHHREQLARQQEEHRVHQSLLEKTLREQLDSIAPRNDADMLDGVASALATENEKQKMQAQADDEEAYQRDSMRSALHAIAPSHEFDYDVTRESYYAELIQMETPNAAVHRGAPSSSGSPNGLTPPFYCSLCKSCGNYASAKTEIIRCRRCGSENIEDRSVDL
ncbi:unnamed protein product, partial [Prorocentrum cordatum]